MGKIGTKELRGGVNSKQKKNRGGVKSKQKNPGWGQIRNKNPGWGQIQKKYGVGSNKKICDSVGLQNLKIKWKIG